MRTKLTSTRKEDRAAFRAFAHQEFVSYADLYDCEERTPREPIQKLAQQGYLGAIISKTWGGSNMDMVTLGLLHEEIGYVCSSVRSLLTVHSMVSYALQKWGSASLKRKWLPGWWGTSLPDSVHIQNAH